MREEETLMKKFTLSNSGISMKLDRQTLMNSIDRIRQVFVKNTGTTFQPGDLVTAFGCNGVVKKLSDNGMFLEVTLEGAPSTIIFDLDGKLFKWAKCPSLEKR